MKTLLLAFWATAGLSAFENPLGTIICADELHVNGILLAPEAVYSWPIFSRDEVQTSSRPAFVYLPDASRIVIDRDSLVNFQSSAQGISITLIEGRIGFSIRNGSHIRIAAKGAADISEKSGRLSFRRGQLEWSPGSPVLPGTEPAFTPPQMPSIGIFIPR